MYDHIKANADCVTRVHRGPAGSPWGDLQSGHSADTLCSLKSAEKGSEFREMGKNGYMLEEKSDLGYI